MDSRDLDEGHLYLATFMHRMGVDRLEISDAEMDAMCADICGREQQLVVVVGQTGVTLQFVGCHDMPTDDDVIQ